MRTHIISVGRLIIFLVSFVLTGSHALLAEDWKTFTGCRLVPNPANDGDSFHVSHGGKRYIFRLYFVDCPESDTLVPERVTEQAKHHRVSEEAVMHIGKYSTAVAKQLLSRPFTVVTKFEDAMGQSSEPRYYAFVTTADGEDLGEIMAASGLARAYGMAASPPGKSEQALRARYDRLVAEARRNRYGIYSPKPLVEIRRPASLKLTEEIPEAAPVEEMVPLGPDLF